MTDRDGGNGTSSSQSYSYRPQYDDKEPDWRRLPGFRDVSEADWRSGKWQGQHSANDVAKLKEIFGDFLDDALAEDIAKDQQLAAQMGLLIPPQMLNTMNERNLREDPVRRYMAPAFSERCAEEHPMAGRDSLHEIDMRRAEGLTHRYPTKVLAELTDTCPQYCGHCTRMDQVGPNTPQVEKNKFELRQPDRWAAMLEYLRQTPTVRDVVVSGGDIANVPIARLEGFVNALLDIDHIRDIRLATKALIGVPQRILDDEFSGGLERIAKKAREKRVNIAIHTHANAAQQITPLVGEAVDRLLDMGYRDVRNQGVLMRGVNATPTAILDLCYALLDNARIIPYYFYMCDMIPKAEHWRTAVWQAQEIQQAIMGHLPGYGTPRIVCDVPWVGKRWVHQTVDYDREKGVSFWVKNYKTHARNDPSPADGRYPFYDPIDTLPEAGQEHWRAQTKPDSGQARVMLPIVKP